MEKKRGKCQAFPPWKIQLKKSQGFGRKIPPPSGRVRAQTQQVSGSKETHSEKQDVREETVMQGAVLEKPVRVTTPKKI